MSTETIQSDSGVPSDTEEIPNPERGCGYLKEGKAYLRADVAAGGELPAFVEFRQPIPFKEDRKRSYKEFPGLQFELSVTGPGGQTETVPEEEVERHLERLLADRPTGTHAGAMVEFESHDLLLSVGKSHYPTVEEFVDEARLHGVSKAISVTSGNSPPVVNPGRTRLFLIHPRAVETTKEIETTASEMQVGDELLEVDGEEADQVTDLGADIPVTVRRTIRTPGIFGYTYLTRVVYTEDADGEIPKYIQDYEDTGDLDVVKPATPEPYSEQVAYDDEGQLREEYRELIADHDANLDAGSVLDQLDAAEDEIRAVAEGETVVVTEPDVFDLDRADLGDLAGQGWFDATAPREDQDLMAGADDGALAILDGQAVFPSNNLNVRDNESHTRGISVVGPYQVDVRAFHDGSRQVNVNRTR